LDAVEDQVDTQAIVEFLRKNIVIIACGCLVAFYLIGFVDSVITDKKENRLNWGRVAVKQQFVRKNLKDFLNSLMPIELTRTRWIDIFWGKMFIMHDWSSIILPFNADRDYRSTKWLIGMGKLINFMFISTFMSYLFFNDDGHCEKFYTQKSCESAVSMDVSNSVCHWNKKTDLCYFNNRIGKSFISVMILTTFIILMAIPLDNLVLFFSFHVRDFLAEKLEKNPYLDNAHSSAYELHSLQTRVGTLFRAARLKKMQRLMNDTQPSEIEAENMLTKDVPIILSLLKNEDKIEMTALDTKTNFSGDSFVNAKRIPWGNSPEIKRNIASKIDIARATSSLIVKEMSMIEHEYHQELFLFKSFIVNSLTGYKRNIADRYFFPRFKYQQKTGDEEAASKFWQKVALIVLPTYCLLAIIIIIVFGMKIGYESTPAWFYCVLLSFAQDILINQPMKIFMKFIIVPTIISMDVFAWFLSLMTVLSTSL